MRILLHVLRLQLPIWIVTPLVSIMLIFGVGVGYISARLFAPPASCPESPEICEEFTVFWQTWDLARERFVDEQAADPEKMTAGAVNGMLDSLGDEGHTRFLTAEEAQRWSESLTGNFEGIGVYVDVQDGRALVIEPIEGAPAQQAGIRAGDEIIAVDGESTRGWSVEELSTKVRGPEGSSVQLSIRRAGEPELLEIVVERAAIDIPSVSWSMLPDSVALVRLNGFAERSAEEMEQALRAAKTAGARALILDLRNNPGGLVNQAVAIAGEFLPAGSTVLLEEDRAGNRESWKTRGEGLALDLPLVVLVNTYTASSAEIVSGALQDAGRAQVIGVPTVGTGTVLTTYNLEGGARLLLGTGQWLTPNGRLIRNEGITPDIEVQLPDGGEPLSPSAAAQLSAEALGQSGDAQLARAFAEVGAAARR